MSVVIAKSTLIEGPGTRPHRIVLFKREHARDPYVVHYVAEEDTDDRWQGTYTDSIWRAGEEFERRLRLCNVRDQASLSPTARKFDRAGC
jgi:hypothetical protein